MISSQIFTHHVLTNISPNIPKPTLENTISPITGWNIEWQQSSTMFSMNHKAVNRRTISPRHSVKFWVWLGRFKMVIAQENHPKTNMAPFGVIKHAIKLGNWKSKANKIRELNGQIMKHIYGTQKELNGLSSHGCLITKWMCLEMSQKAPIIAIQQGFPSKGQWSP